MATEYYNIVGKCAWAKNLFVPDVSKYGKKWSLDVYPDPDGLEVYKETGMQLKPIKKPYFDGEVGYKFRRDVEKRINGEMQQFDPPTVKNKDGTDWPDNVSIGNGTVVEANIAVYDTVMGKGHRLMGVTILEHVPYDAPSANEKVAGATKTATSGRVAAPW